MNCIIMGVVDVYDWRIFFVKGFLDDFVLIGFKGVVDVVFFVCWWCRGQLEGVWGFDIYKFVFEIGYFVDFFCLG